MRDHRDRGDARTAHPAVELFPLQAVQAPTLLIVGGSDREALAANRRALARLSCPRALHVVEGAGRLFDERGALADVIEVTAHWFAAQLMARPPAWAVGAGDARPQR